MVKNEPIGRVVAIQEQRKKKKKKKKKNWGGYSILHSVTALTFTEFCIRVGGRVSIQLGINLTKGEFLSSRGHP